MLLCFPPSRPRGSGHCHAARPRANLLVLDQPTETLAAPKSRHSQRPSVGLAGTPAPEGTQGGAPLPGCEGRVRGRQRHVHGDQPAQRSQRKDRQPAQGHGQRSRPATGTWLRCWLTSRDNELRELQRESYKTARTHTDTDKSRPTCASRLQAGSFIPESFTRPRDAAQLTGKEPQAA